MFVHVKLRCEGVNASNEITGTNVWTAVQWYLWNPRLCTGGSFDTHCCQQRNTCNNSKVFHEATFMKGNQEEQENIHAAVCVQWDAYAGTLLTLRQWRKSHAWVGCTRRLYRTGLRLPECTALRAVHEKAFYICRNISSFLFVIKFASPLSE